MHRLWECCNWKPHKLSEYRFATRHLSRHEAQPALNLGSRRVLKRQSSDRCYDTNKSQAFSNKSRVTSRSPSRAQPQIARICRWVRIGSFLPRAGDVTQLIKGHFPFSGGISMCPWSLCGGQRVPTPEAMPPRKFKTDHRRGGGLGWHLYRLSRWIPKRFRDNRKALEPVYCYDITTCYCPAFSYGGLVGFCGIGFHIITISSNTPSIKRSAPNMWGGSPPPPNSLLLGPVFGLVMSLNRQSQIPCQPC